MKPLTPKGRLLGNDGEGRDDEKPFSRQLRALQGVTYISVSDDAGRMDEDIFGLLEDQSDSHDA